MKVVSVVGARPEFIQAAPLSRAIRTRHQEVLVHTGQHYDYDMSEVFFQQLSLPKPDYNLGVGSGSHARQTGEILSRMEAVLQQEKPDWVLVRGDTNSTLAGALAAAKLCIPVAHVESGLRSYDAHMPEEINRVVTDHLSDVLFCPTPTAMDNLGREGLSQRASLVGDVMYEAILIYIEQARRESRILKELGLQSKSYLLVTVHRAANTDDVSNLQGIVAALNAISEPIVFPVHPRTRSRLKEYGLVLGAHVKTIEPVSYFDLLVLESDARLVLTDSGGMTKEAYIVGTPCLTLRDLSEWIETVEAGWNTVVGADTVAILQAVRHFQPSSERPALYGDGKTSLHIVEALERYVPKQSPI
ncbi:MAG: UDP-N-acetylglucosamine 2-epimerase (non-hydrolyzing) [Dehalococcoidia bacterium]|nr:UDP-N-acetylglucosamine 2-epimerase (non-hydrolyzing) [Dehalococcoidia bacterium]